MQPNTHARVRRVHRVHRAGGALYVETPNPNSPSAQQHPQTSCPKNKKQVYVQLMNDMTLIKQPVQSDLGQRVRQVCVPRCCLCTQVSQWILRPAGLMPVLRRLKWPPCGALRAVNKPPGSEYTSGQ